MRILFLITARGGSKSIPGKNLCQVGGLSLLGYKAVSARRTPFCTRLIISSDSAEIQEEARRHGADVPFTRPSELATDTASSAHVVQHAMEWIETHEEAAYDAVMLLEPSSPFATATDYDRAIELMMNEEADVVVGLRRMEVNSVFVGPLGDGGNFSAIAGQIAGLTAQRRQDLHAEYTPNGALYLFRWETFRRTGSIYQAGARTFGYPMDQLHSLEIDEPIDLAWARFLVEQKHLDLTPWLP